MQQECEEWWQQLTISSPNVLITLNTSAESVSISTVP